MARARMNQVKFRQERDEEETAVVVRDGSGIGKVAKKTGRFVLSAFEWAILLMVSFILAMLMTCGLTWCTLTMCLQ